VVDDRWSGKQHSDAYVGHTHGSNALEFFGDAVSESNG
jgi:hypothetical protein